MEIAFAVLLWLYVFTCVAWGLCVAIEIQKYHNHSVKKQYAAILLNIVFCPFFMLAVAFMKLGGNKE